MPCTPLPRYYRTLSGLLLQVWRRGEKRSYSTRFDDITMVDDDYRVQVGSGCMTIPDRHVLYLDVVDRVVEVTEDYAIMIGWVPAPVARRMR